MVTDEKKEKKKIHKEEEERDEEEDDDVEVRLSIMSIYAIKFCISNFAFCI